MSPKLAWIFLGIIIGLSIAGNYEISKSSLGKTSSFSDPMWRELNGFSSLFAMHWYRNGPLKDEFRLSWDLPHPSWAQGHDSRYNSFPFGYLLPVYLFAKIKNEAPSVQSVALVAKIAHLAGLLLCAFIAWLLVRKSLPFWQAWLAILAACLVCALSLPGLLWTQVWFPDTAAPWALILFLALSLAKEKKILSGRTAALLVGLSIFFGVLTHWIFLPSVVLFSLLPSEEKRPRKINVNFLIPVALALTLIWIQIDGFTGLESIFLKLKLRLDPSNFENSNARAIITHGPWITLADQLGYSGLAILFASLLIPITIWVGRRKELFFEARYLATLAFPPAIYFLIVRQHFILHPFPIMHFLPVLAIGGFCLLPMALAQYRHGHWLLLFLPFLFTGICVHSFYRYRAYTAGALALSVTQTQLCEMMRNKIKPEDLVFSSGMALSMKRTFKKNEIRDLIFSCQKEIYFVSSENDIANKVTELRGPLSYTPHFCAETGLFLLTIQSESPPPWTKRLGTTKVAESGPYQLFALQTEKLDPLIEKQKKSP